MSIPNSNQWLCIGGRHGKTNHQEEIIDIGEKCPICGLPETNILEEHKPKIFLAALILIIAVFFVYYKLLRKEEQKQITKEEQQQNNFQRASAAHYNLISEVFTPIKQKATELESDIETKTTQIREEIRGNRESGEPGCGDNCKQLKNEKEQLEAKYNKIIPILTDLKPLFEYELEGKSPEEIFNKDMQAIGKVPQNCLPEDQEFDCLPQKYQGILNPSFPKYEELRNIYFGKNYNSSSQ